MAKEKEQASEVRSELKSGSAMFVNSNTGIFVYAALATDWFARIRAATKVTSSIHVIVLVGKSHNTQGPPFEGAISNHRKQHTHQSVDRHSCLLSRSKLPLHDEEEALRQHNQTSRTHVSELDVLVTNGFAFPSINFVRIVWRELAKLGCTRWLARSMKAARIVIGGNFAILEFGRGRDNDLPAAVDPSGVQPLMDEAVDATLSEPFEVGLFGLWEDSDTFSSL